MTNIQWLGSAAPSGVGQVRLRTPGQGLLPSSTNIFNRFDNSLFQFTPPRRAPQLRTPPRRYQLTPLISCTGNASKIVSLPAIPFVGTREQATARAREILATLLVWTSGGYQPTSQTNQAIRLVDPNFFVVGPNPISCTAQVRVSDSTGTISTVRGLPEGDGALGQISTFEECFANPDCDQCWRTQFANAQRECNPGSDDYDECVNELARQFTRDRCFPNFGGTGTRIDAYPWGQLSDETCLHQDQVNAVLLANGYQAIARDCRTGPRTCGASSVATQIDPSVGIPDTCFAHQSEWVLPARATQPPPVEVPPVVTPVPTTAKAGVGAGGLALLAAAVLGGIYLVTQVA
jgi:hypothetical protein